MISNRTVAANFNAIAPVPLLSDWGFSVLLAFLVFSAAYILLKR
jgi:hypothetical protein